MTYGEYLEKCTDEFEKTVIIANLAREYPNYDRYSPRYKAQIRKELLSRKIPEGEKDNGLDT